MRIDEARREVDGAQTAAGVEVPDAQFAVARETEAESGGGSVELAGEGRYVSGGRG